MANCILRLVTSNGYDNDCATAPAKPPQSNFAGTDKTRPPKEELTKQLLHQELSWAFFTCISF